MIYFVFIYFCIFFIQLENIDFIVILFIQEEINIPSEYDVTSQACYLLPFLCSTLDNLQQALIEMSLWTLFTELEMKIVPILAGLYIIMIIIMDRYSVYQDFVYIHIL